MINMFFTRKFYPLFFFAIIFVINSEILTATRADSILNGLRIETKVNYGFIYPHHKAIQYLLAGNITGFEIGLSTESNGMNSWEELYRFPRYGVAYNYTNLSNPDILGYAHGLFGYIDVPFFRPVKNFSMNYQIDGGIVYITEKYNEYNNPLNLAISSSVNVYIGLDINARFKVHKKNEIKTGLELTHYSNGKWHSPNLGLNSVSLSVAWLYSLKPSHNPLITSHKIKDYKRNLTEIILNTGFKRDDLLNEKLYFVSTAIIDYYRFFTPKYALGTGSDFFYDASLSHTKSHVENTTPVTSDNYQLGLHVGILSRYGRLNFLLNAGYYTHAQYLKYSRVYSRIGLRYSVGENIVVNFTLKAHYAIADYLEWGIGYRFNSAGR